MQLWAGVILVGVVLGGWLLGFVTPMDADRGVGLILGGVIGLFAGLVAAAGVTGGLLMVGRWGVVPGVAVGVSLFGAVAASSADGPWVAVALLGFVAAIVGFYIAGLRSGFIPPVVVKTFGSPLAVVGGLVSLWIGTAQGNLQAIMVGVGFILVALVIGGYGLFERARERREEVPPANAARKISPADAAARTAAVSVLAGVVAAAAAASALAAIVVS